MRNKIISTLIVLFGFITTAIATPGTPTISSPSGSGTTYNTRPWIVFAAADGSHQINDVRVQIDDTSNCSSPVYDYWASGSAQNRASFYPLPANGGVSIRHRLNPNGTALTAGTWYVRVWVRCASATSRECPAWSAIKTIVIGSAPAGVTEEITAGTTRIRAAHFNDLKTVITNLRTFRGNAAFSWDSSWSTGLDSADIIRIIHLNNLRDGLETPYNSATGSNPTYTAPDPMTSGTIIRKQHMDELRNGIYLP